MFRKMSLVLLFLNFLIFHSSAIDLLDPLTVLGSTIDDIFQADSRPAEIFPNRGVEPDEDNVVFYYDNGFYLFLFNNRVWQVRYDKTFSGELYKLRIGMSREDVLSGSLSQQQIPISSGEDFVTFELSQSPYPLRMKLYFMEGMLEDLYIYRADF